MHPLIRIACFLVFSAWLAFGGAERLWCAALLLAIAYAVTSPAWLRQGVRMSLRLRWFMLSLLIVYGWFTPGRAFLADEGTRVAALMPTAEGLAAGLARMAALVLIVFAVNLLLRASTRDDLLSGVYGLVRPLALFGLSRERVALRMVLVMDALEGMRELVQERLAARPRDVPALQLAGRLVAGLIQEVIDRAGSRREEPITLAVGGPPPAVQWSYPLLLCLGFIVAGLAGGIPGA